MNKLVKGMFALGMGALMVGCSSGTSDSGSQQINVVSREEGSGTREHSLNCLAFRKVM